VRRKDADTAIAADHQEIGILPPLYPEWLGDRSFCAAHGTRFAYVAGEMANGIATTKLVAAVAGADMLGFFGAAGLPPDRVAAAIDELTGQLRGRANWGVNLIHSPNEPAVEQRVAALLLERRVLKISASAFLDLTPAVVRCAVAGLRTDASGRVVRPVAMFAKVSRPEVAEKFMLPAPEPILAELVRGGQITQAEARLAARVPVAEDITVEADSGGHTDQRPLVSLLPTIIQLRDTIVGRQRYDRPIRVGAAGGLGTPAGVAAAFALGAAYVVTGSVNQISVESGLSPEAKRQLSQADIADVAMAPSSDMFELGVKVQVLRRGTMFAARATQLYELYQGNPSLEAIPAATMHRLERDVFRAPVSEIWTATRQFWLARDPAELRRAEQDGKHRMALVFRWYLGQSSRWAINGDTERQADYQIWCGPAMGAFNRWVDGGFLSHQENRSVVQIARNLLEGAAVLTRVHQLRTYGVPMPTTAFGYSPRSLT
jgi:PfaD family protein